MGENQLAIYEEVVRQMVERLDHVEVPDIESNIIYTDLLERGKHTMLLFMRKAFIVDVEHIDDNLAELAKHLKAC